MKNILLSLILFLSWSVATYAQVQSIDVSNQVTTPNHYIIPKVIGGIPIDGIAEEVWEKSEFTQEFVDIEGQKAVAYSTKIKMLWDVNYLYVYAELEDPHIWGDITKRDAIIYYNNDFEVFVDPSGKGEVYGEIEMNALNTVWDLLLNKPYRSGGFANFHWDLDSLITAVHVDGSLNNPSDVDKRWTLEMAIPMKALIELKNDHRMPIKEGDQWRMNFSRVQWEHDLVDGSYTRKKINGAFQPEQNWVWSEQTAINMHLPEMWGTVQFTHRQSGDGVVFNADPDQSIKQVLYALYRKVRISAGSKIIPNEVGQEVEITARYSANDSVLVKLVKTHFGYELSALSSSTSLIHIVNEKGERTQFLNKPQLEKPFTLSTWSHGSKDMDSAIWLAKLDEYASMGISEVLVGGSPEFLADLVQLAKPKNIKIHAWMWTLNRPNDTIANKHPEWYAVNRNGENSLDYRAYVDYYQWLSPFSEDAREYIKNNVKKLLAVEGLASIHLDYVRYVDVILGADLQPKYNLVQTEEMPEYDYGYHPNALSGYEDLFGINPIEMEHPELSTEWRQYRLNAVTSLVNEIAEMVHTKDQLLTAAVFPFPEMSRQMVRQAWDDWDLDAAYPMIYHNFYRQNINWVGYATEQGVKDVDFPINTGLYIPGFNNAEEFEEAILLARAKGAVGVSIFTADGLKQEFKDVLKKLHSLK
ncbi:MAG: hypothetical protein ACI865_000299 [Flavobacteriaceae bacterium]|jgi:hypothetical protein